MGGVTEVKQDAGRWWRRVRVCVLVVGMVGAVTGGLANAASQDVIGLSEVRLGTGSILQALLDSQYSELVWYLDKAAMLQEVEQEVERRGSVTVLAPKNSFLEQHVDPQLKAYLLQPGHESSLQRVLRHHMLPGRLEGADWGNQTLRTLSPGDTIGLRSFGLKRFVEFSRVFSPNSIVRKDGIVHGLDGFMVPKAVMAEFQAWKKNGARDMAVLPESPPAMAASKAIRSSSRASFMLQQSRAAAAALAVAPVVAPAAAPAAAKKKPPPGTALPVTPVPAPAPLTTKPSPPLPSFVSAPAMSPDIAPAPGPGTAEFALDAGDETLQFVTALMTFGGYNDMADLLMNYTTLGVELGKLARMGYKLTILAPNDQAMQQLTAEQLNSPLEPLLYYHMLSEYQTEESMYNAVKRLGKQSYSTLRHPHKVTATESDGTVQFGEAEDAAHIFDHDIYVDGHISVQGISKVLVLPSS